MDGQGFDRFARLLGSGMSRRQVVRTLAAGTGASVLAAVGLGSAVSDSLAATAKLRLARSPRVTFDGLDAIVAVQASQIASCVVEYGPTKALGASVASNGMARSHQLRITGLAPKTRYYFRVTLQTEEATVTSAFYNFQSPGCPGGTTLCGGACVAACGSHAARDSASCACVCSSGFADCDGDGSCETTLGTVDNCLACGNACDDGNACTDNACDPNAGCTTTNVADGAPCGTNGTCTNGACQACAAGGSCGADRECCDDEVCCGGACVAKTALLADAGNCGKCGNACAAAPCQAAVCVDGACQTEAAAEGDSCDDGNPCTEHDHCMGGMCMGNPVADGTPCGDAATCRDGVCVTCKAGGSCKADGECCAGEACCDGTCVAVSSFDSDPANCGACGHACEGNGVCRQTVCEHGACGARVVKDGEACDDGNPCTKHTRCRDGVCTGSPVRDGTVCGDAGTCQAGACVEPHAMAVAAVGPLFADDFELGNLSRWSSTKGITVQTSIVAAGTYAARAAGKGTAAYARKSLSPAQTDLAVRTRFQLVSQGSNAVDLLCISTPSSPLMTVLVTSAGKLATVGNAGSTVAATPTTSTIAISPGVWHELQLRATVAGANSIVEVWLDGTRIAELSKTVDLGATAIGQVQLGENLIGRTYDVVFDDAAVCAGGLCDSSGNPVGADQVGGTSQAPGAASGVLLATYTHNSSKGSAVDWSKVAYRPRQFAKGLVIVDPSWGAKTVEDAGAYVGWDILPTYNYSVHRVETLANWTEIELNRAAVLTVVWRGGAVVPNWLAAWTKAGNVVVSGKTLPTYQKSFGAGLVSLGGVYNPSDSPTAVRDTYWILFAEADGGPSPAPLVPAGREAPVPNATCPTWVHEQYTATGPDGVAYATWHHQIDPVYWCYHRHEHGTNPLWFASDKMPAFGYTAAKHGMTEPHTGFKNHVFDSQDGTRWMVTHHFGTAGIGRACNRFHTVDIAVRNIASGELLADLHLMGDFGKSVVNTTDVPYTPPACPTQASDAAGSSGIRKIPSQADGPTFYEPWRVDLKKTLFGFVGDFTINSPEGIVICNNSTCDQAVTTGKTGARHFFTPNLGPKGDYFSLVGGSNTGVFYTDPSGAKRLNAGDPGAVRQYIKAGMKASVQIAGIHCWDVYAWGKKLVCDASNGNSTCREGSITPPN